MVKKYSIYVYQCPITFEYFYIGKDKCYGKRGYSWDSYHEHGAVGNKVRKLKRLKLKPYVHRLLEFDEVYDVHRVLINAEIFWIAEGRRRNWPLLNCTKGGEGGNGGANKGKPSPLKGIKRPPEVVQKMKIALTGKKNGPKPGTSQKLKGRKRPELSFPGDKNPMFNPVTNEELISYGKYLYQRDGKLIRDNWSTYAKEIGTLIVVSSRFGSFGNFKMIVKRGLCNA